MFVESGGSETHLGVLLPFGDELRGCTVVGAKPVADAPI